jgi:Zn-dependent metalloprotease
MLDGSYALAYRVTADNAVTYVIDAHGGHVLMEVDEKREQSYGRQSAVGSGRGVRGDVKKVSASQNGSWFEARDQLRPATIWTFDARGRGDRVLNRLIRGEHRASDRATDSDNAWTIPGVVDAHVHAGWVHDYLFKQHSWSGMDGRGGSLYSAVADQHGLPNNAYFVAPPYGPGGAGMVAFGETHSGTPMTTLDVVAHELMHGVTHFGVTQRVGRYAYGVFFEQLGPSSAWWNGKRYRCSSTTLRVEGVRRRYYCKQGKYVLYSNEGGAIGEGLSDVFGTAAEFFFQSEGTGPLRADYLMGEDISDPSRSLSDPTSMYVNPQRTLRYPDHFNNRLRFTAIWIDGQLYLTPFVIRGSNFFWANSTNYGGVHWNSTILSHVFYLAVEGGTNRTSGRYVRGVGGANRRQIERVFFRAVTELMPRQLGFLHMADVLQQAAIDLFGFSDPATTAVYDAVRAVGLV